MKRRNQLAAVIIFQAVLFGHANALDDRFSVEIEVKSSTATKIASHLPSPTREKPSPRVQLKAKANETLQVSWKVKNASTPSLPDILVHCFVVSQKSLGQREVPKLDKDVVYESALTMDFKPKDQASGQMTLKMERPGYYLLRVEALDPDGARSSGDFAAIDIEIE